MLRLIIVSILVAVVVETTPRVRPAVPTFDERIVGGQPATIKELPYQLSLQVKGRHNCGASIISTTRALTAAHCTYGKRTEDLSVRAGSSFREAGGQVITLSAVCQHPDFNPTTYDNDVSVLWLAQPLSVGAIITLVDLDGAPSQGTLATVSGWGALWAGGPSPVQLHKVQVPRISQTYCKVAYGASRITENMICFGYPLGGMDSCQGDSGGPLVVDGRQVGIVSWGEGCAYPSRPGIYADISVPSIRNIIDQCLA